MAPAVPTRRPRILYLDAYDSFSNNIIAQVEQCIDVDVVKCYIDSDPGSWIHPGVTNLAKTSANTSESQTAEFIDYAKTFDAVVAGPGPGSATCGEDVGYMRGLWELQDSDTIPVLGICLGFQSMCSAFGADIQRLPEPRHGLVAEILHHGASIFDGIKQLHATQYHSLQVMLGHQVQTKKAVRYPAGLWEPTETCPELQPLAWDFENKRNGAVLMAAKHTTRPFWGVQFHPESICTNSQGLRIVQNWWDEAMLWNHRRNVRKSCESEIVQRSIEPGLSEAEQPSYERMAMYLVHGDKACQRHSTVLDVQCATTGSGRLTISDIVELFDIPHGEAIVLESGLQRDLRPMAAGTGQHSIIGLFIPGETMRLHYYTNSRTMQLRDGVDRVLQKWHTDDPWQWIRRITTQFRKMLGQKPNTPTWAPFWGGLMGFASYEAGLQTINVQANGESDHPDICFAYITRSIVVDHQLKKIYVQSIRNENDMPWVNESLEKLYDAVGRKSLESTPNPTPLPRPNPFEHQDTTLSTYLASCKQSVAHRDTYGTSVALCQEHIAAGQSYEICLTTMSEIHARRPRICRLSRAEDNELSWKLYKRLTARNAAPFSAYMRLHNAHILSSSPERYICWDRQQVSQCRPIKGTVSKSPGVTTADAHSILETPKERAENLMIVDLVRHQLHGVYGAGNVHVPQLMQVEEYETLWQLVSVVEGVPAPLSASTPPDAWQDAPTPCSASEAQQQSSSKECLGFDAFVQSLPAGSMTGAPKKRSCEILMKEEGGRRRGIYSGVLGYLDIGGGGDFNVVIRTAVKIDQSSATEDVWRIGAGGAVTALSDPDQEYEEMLAKFNATAAAFEDTQDLQTEEVSEKGVWSRLMEVEEMNNEERENLASALQTLQDFRAGLLSGMTANLAGEGS
ncbi:para-aminobenzoate synthase, (PABA) [Kalmusia sp. IMI 367209]|nr:para-aminobenzoate synthase, (PABA) [Kalmusia sp. IMI 367209]